MDYSFSPANLRRVWDIQTRKGRDLLPLFPELEEKYDNFRGEREDLREEIKREGVDQEFARWAWRRLREIKREMDGYLLECLTDTSNDLISDVEDDVFSWGLERGPENKARQTFRIKDAAKVYFADKQMQRNVSHVLPRYPASRNEIISALAASLDNEIPKVVVRADVHAFYESIDHSILHSVIAESTLNPTSQNLVRMLLSEYAKITGEEKGVPTGVGLSSKLGELFISQIDRPMREHGNVLYYARYVDDIVVVFGVGEESDEALLNLVKEKLESLGLEINSDKNFVRRLNVSSKAIAPFEFLGYSIEYNGGVHVKISNQRMRRIKERVELSMKAWSGSEKKGVNHGKRKLLLNRLSFLTGNTRLTHNKRNALVGIYFTNPHVTNPATLGGLDKYLQSQLSRFEVPEDLRRKIEFLSFEDGFRKRRMCRFTAKEMRDIVGAWRE